MRAAILAVGSELLGTDRLDTNSLTLTAVLRRFGVALDEKVVAGDDQDAIAGHVRRLVGSHELVLVTGGLGPTSDDVTREATAAAFDLELHEDPAIVAEIAARFAAMDRRMPEVNRRQAQVIAGAQVLANRRGTAPGLRLDAGGATIFLFPGVPSELVGLIDSDLIPWLEARCGGATLETATLRIACLPESEVEERIAPAYAEFGRAAITILAAIGDIRVQMSARGAQAERQQRLGAMRARIAALVGKAVYSEREEDDLETVVVAALASAGSTLATAESCTGGLVAERVTRVPGSSAVFLGAVVAYSDAVKERALGVPMALLVAHGAVSEEVARALAIGARQTMGSDWGIGVTGIAGPGGGTEAKPVGTVHVAVAGPHGTLHRRLRFPGERRRVRELASQVALEMLRRAVQENALDDTASAPPALKSGPVALPAIFARNPDALSGPRRAEASAGQRKPAARAAAPAEPAAAGDRTSEASRGAAAIVPLASSSPASSSTAASDLSAFVQRRETPRRSPATDRRLFVALELPPEAQAALAARLEPLRARSPRARWVAAENLHLTLHFVGPTPDENLPELTAALRAAFAPEVPLRLQVVDGGSFPPGRSARVLWAGVRSGHDLQPLHTRVAGACSRVLERTLDGKPFHPHVTVARADPPWPLAAVQELTSVLAGEVSEAFLVARGVLIQSALGRGGSRYTTVDEFPMTWAL